jgi:hypothetical protein
VVFETRDGGDSWLPAAETPLAGEAPGSAPLAGLSEGRWTFALPGEARAYTFEAQVAGETLLAPLAAPELPAGSLAFELTASGLGWARSLRGACQGTKPAGGAPDPASDDFRCETHSGLWLTTDGGRTWVEITP